MTLTHEPTANPPGEWEEPIDEELDAEPSRRRFALLTGILAVLVVGGAAFLGGVQVQKRHDRALVSTTNVAATGAVTGTGTGTGRGAGGTRTGTGTGTGTGGFGGAGGATVGQVKLVDGATIYVTDSTGNTITVVTTGASKYAKTQTVTLKDIQPGDTVVIRGATQPDGSVSATTVTDSGAGGAVGGGRFGGGGGGTGTGATGSATTAVPAGGGG
jgi:hypothetical protein